MLSSPDYKLLQKEGAKVEEAMHQMASSEKIFASWSFCKNSKAFLKIAFNSSFLKLSIPYVSS
jgi:uncharacterized membrane protein SpoIIM required for sporulation